MLMLASLAVMSCASNEVAKPIEEKTITISLESNRTTGYSWVCEIDKMNVAEFIAEEYVIDKNIVFRKENYLNENYTDKNSYVAYEQVNELDGYKIYEVKQYEK